MKLIKSKITNKLLGTLLAIIPSLAFTQEIIKEKILSDFFWISFTNLLLGYHLIR